jgi:hypothetical protein
MFSARAAIPLPIRPPIRRNDPCPSGAGGPVKIPTSCPSCLRGLARFAGDTGIESDYIVVEMARCLPGRDWLPAFVERAKQGGIERVLL